MTATAAGDLLRDLGALALRIDEIEVETGAVAVPSYPDGARPTSTVRLHGAGQSGHGEHVGWTRAAHEAFAARSSHAALRGRHRLGALAGALPDLFPEPYDRAAVEAAAVELALAQNGTDLPALAAASGAAAPRPIRYVVSFDLLGDPLARMRAERRACRGLEFKLDVDPGWDDARLGGLAAAGGIAVLDFKGRGEAADHERFARCLPDALLEDALAPATLASSEMRRRLSFDAPLGPDRRVAALDPLPAALNVKPARMGGVLVALAAIDDAARLGCRVYFGGMFEVGVGRLQLQALAALFSPDGPNDVAPLLSGARPPRLDPPGGVFGTA